MADRDPGAMVPTAVDPLLWRSKWPLNDLGNAQRFAVLAKGRLKFVEEIGRGGDWMWFDGMRWTTHDAAGRARSIAMAVCDELQDESRALMQAADDDVRAVYGPKFAGGDLRQSRVTELYTWAMKSGDSARTSGLLKQAPGLVDGDGLFLMRAALEDFDTDLMAYHCQNGTLRFVQTPDGWVQKFEPGHRPEDMFTQVASVLFEPGALCPQWTARLVELHDDPVARTAIQRIYGMTLTGLISDQAFYIFQGRGGDGKSMTNLIISEMHGDYFRSASPKTFLLSKQQKSGSDHQSDIVRLRGDIRMVVADEPTKGSTWDGERIKQVTGSRIVARGANATEEVTYVPHWKLIIECNPMPSAPSDDRGFRRRFKLLPWLKSYGVTPGLKDEPTFVVEPRLRAEGPGILNWMIEGTLAWLDSNEVPEPEISRVASNSFWATGSIMGEWLRENCDVTDPTAATLATPLYEDFRAYCIATGMKEDRVPNRTIFGKNLTEGQFYAGKEKRSNLVTRVGIRLKSDLTGSGGSGERGADDDRFGPGWSDADAGRWDSTRAAGGDDDADPFGAP